MIRTKKYFDRGDHMLEVDTTSGKRVTRLIPKLSTATAAHGLATGKLRKVKPDQPKRPGPIRRAVNYGKAAVQHVAAGQPKASLASIGSRFAICQGCPSDLYQILEPEKIPQSLKELDEVGTCLHKGCGCFLHATETEPAKLSWADQVCPHGHWGKAVSGA